MWLNKSWISNHILCFWLSPLLIIIYPPSPSVTKSWTPEQWKNWKILKNQRKLLKLSWTFPDSMLNSIVWATQRHDPLFISVYPMICLFCVYLIFADFLSLLNVTSSNRDRIIICVPHLFWTLKLATDNRNYCRPTHQLKSSKKFNQKPSKKLI